MEGNTECVEKFVMYPDTAAPENDLRLLKKFFGQNSFRSLKWSVFQIASIGKGQVVVMSTIPVMSGNICSCLVDF